jgi:hypothetical protein
MAYTTIDKPDDYFNTKLYTGTGATQSITGVNFQPDWVWIKERSASASDHNLSDAVRGAGKALFSNTTGAEYDYGTGTGGNLRSFDSDGFSLGTASQTNDNGTTFVSWNWLANGAGVSNTAGDITSTVSASTTSGFSIVSYTGNGTGGATVGHGLGVTPKMIIIKGRGTTYNWVVGHNSLSTNWGKYLTLSTTDAVETATNVFNDTAPTSLLFSIGTALGVNTSSSTYIAYCFAEKKGFSKFGSYTGNGSTNGTFVYTGMRPAFVMIKRTDTTGNWDMYDNKRNDDVPAGANYIDRLLYANANDAEVDTGGAYFLDFLSNGFKLRGTGADINASGGTYIYMAFAENPFVTSTSIPTTAR